MTTLFPEKHLGRLSRPRLIEIGVALVLTVAALLFVVLTVWAVESGGVHVADAWARPTIGKGSATAGYMTIMNMSDKDDVLSAARSAKAESVEIHKTSMTADGVMQMREVEGGLPIAAGGTVELAPGGTHLMIMGLDEALEAGGELPVTLEFSKAGPLDILMPVRATAPDGDNAHH